MNLSYFCQIYCIHLISTVLSTCSPIVAASPWPSATNEEPRDFKPSNVSLKRRELIHNGNILCSYLLLSSIELSFSFLMERHEGSGFGNRVWRRDRLDPLVEVEQPGLELLAVVDELVELESAVEVLPSCVHPRVCLLPGLRKI